MQILLLGLVTCLVIITVGYWVNRWLQMPWMFTVVVFGMVLGSLGLFQEVMEGTTFQFLARMGMLFFLFTIGVDLEFDQVGRLGAYIAGGDILLTLTEGLALGLFLYLGYPEFVSHSPAVAVLCGVAFGTVGEVILLAILKEFRLEKTRFGQLALGIGVFDDVFEMLALAAIVALPAFISGGQDRAWGEALDIVLSLVGIMAVTAVTAGAAPWLRRQFARIPGESFVLPFIIFAFLFAFTYFGGARAENLAVVAAIFAGIAVRRVLPEKAIEQFKKPIYFVGNVFLGPFFFLSLGGTMSLSALLLWPLLIVAIMLISLVSRVLVSYLLFHRLLGRRQAVVMGVGLTAKFSTSVISENLLFTSGLIAQPLYSAIMAAFILLKPFIVAMFSWGLARTRDTVG